MSYWDHERNGFVTHAFDGSIETFSGFRRKKMTEAITHDTLALMRLAAIDVGSNSVHLLIADVSPEGHLEVIDRVKEMVRLGRRSFTTGLLSQEAMDLAVRVLDHFQRLAEIRHVDRVRAVATSAVR